MTIVLRSDVKGLGHKGDVVDVADGYAQNFLIPRGLAMRATAGNQDQAAAMKRSRDVRDARLRADAEEVARDLVAKVVTIPARAGAEGRLYGSVTMADVSEAVGTQTNHELDRRQLSTDEPIRDLGTHLVLARLHDDVQFQFSVEVVSD